MKWFLLILLLAANIVYFGWELNKESKQLIANANQGINVPAEVDRLKKIEELEQALPQREQDSLLAIEQDNSSRAELLDTLTGEAQEGFVSLVSQQTTETILDTTMESDEYSCFSFGPIPDRKIVQALYDWFQSRNLISVIDSGQKETKQLFWIYLAPVRDRAKAIDLIESLKSQGVQDYRLISKGELNNAISLGLFSSQTAVNNRLVELHNKGFKPVVVPYSDVKTVYQLNVRLLKASGVLAEVFSGFPSGFNSIPVKCDGIS